jgi:hypothetical protein
MSKGKVSAGGGVGGAPSEKRANRHSSLVLLVVSTAILLDALDLSITQVALPDIRRSLDLSTSGVQWDRQRLRPHLRRLPSLRRPRGRPAGRPPRLPRRPGHIRRPVVGHRALTERGRVDSRPCRPGHRRRPHRAIQRRDHRRHVRRGPRAQPRLRRLLRGRRLRVLRRPHPRWRPHRPAQLAVDLLREGPDRRNHADHCRPRHPPRRRGPRPLAQLRPARRPARHRRFSSRSPSRRSRTTPSRCPWSSPLPSQPWPR